MVLMVEPQEGQIRGIDFVDEMDEASPGGAAGRR